MQKTLCLAAALVAGLLLSCSDQTTPTGTGGINAPDYSGWRWQAVSIRGLSTIAGSVIFEIDSTSTPFAQGQAACNYYSSVVMMSASGQIEFGPIFRTKMLCLLEVMQTEDVYLAALQDTRSYKIVRNRLEFFDDSGTRLVSFARIAK